MYVYIYSINFYEAAFCRTQELGINKIAHQAKLRQALKIITGKHTSQHLSELFSANGDTTTTPVTMTVNVIPSPTTITDSATIV